MASWPMFLTIVFLSILMLQYSNTYNLFDTEEAFVQMPEAMGKVVDVASGWLIPVMLPFMSIYLWALHLPWHVFWLSFHYAVHIPLFLNTFHRLWWTLGWTGLTCLAVAGYFTHILFPHIIILKFQGDKSCHSSRLFSLPIGRHDKWPILCLLWGLPLSQISLLAAACSSPESAPIHINYLVQKRHLY